MHRTTLGMAGATALIAALVAGSGAASARPGGPAVTATALSSAAPPCTMDDVSFYFGGYSIGIGQVRFDITLLAHDGITCRLSDTPQVTVGSPADQSTPIPVHVNGRGGTLLLRSDSPLHTTVFYAQPDTEEDELQASTLSLAMPDGSKRTTNFLFPGTVDVNVSGVSLKSWTTGTGQGQAEEAP